MNSAFYCGETELYYDSLDSEVKKVLLEYLSSKNRNQKENQIYKSLVREIPLLPLKNIRIRFTHLFDDEKMPYVQSKDNNTRRIHHGQMKLFYTELFFFTQILKHLDQTKPYTVVYVGSAHGYHLPYLMKLLSVPPYNVISEWHLYDPGNFCKELSHTKGVLIYNRLFENSDADDWAKHKNIIFMSDIRRTDKDEDILEDNNLQMGWVEKIRPEWAWLKFRTPYNTSMSYFDSPYYYQPFAPKNSTETRMIVKRPEGDYQKTLYNNIEYEQYACYYNRVVREQSLDLDLQSKDSIFNGKNHKLLPSNYDAFVGLYIYYVYLLTTGRFTNNISDIIAYLKELNIACSSQRVPHFIRD